MSPWEGGCGLGYVPAKLKSVSTPGGWGGSVWMPAESDLFKRCRGMHTCKPSPCWDGEAMGGESHAEP